MNPDSQSRSAAEASSRPIDGRSPSATGGNPSGEVTEAWVVANPVSDRLLNESSASMSPVILDGGGGRNLVQVSEPELRRRSWIVRALQRMQACVANLFGLVSVIFLLAITANIPIIQFLSFGYLLEVTGRLARRESFSQAFVGLKKASRVGGLVLGTWLMLIPVRLISNTWYEAYLIDPGSQQTMFMRVLLVVFMVLIVAHIGAAWLCGGKLRYFFWPVVAPFSIAIWGIRRLAGVGVFRSVLNAITGWFAPGLADDIGDVTPINDWFLPAIFARRILQRGFFVNARDAVWEFVNRLRLPFYFWFGLKGFVGTFLWLLLPTLLLVNSTYSEDGVAVLSGLLGVMFAIPVFSMLPFIQAHYARDGRFHRFFEVRSVWKNLGRAPVAHVIALLMTLVLALPLFFLKIETIPAELMWTLSIVFITFTLPAKMIVGWAYGRGTRRESSPRWWIRFPIVSLVIPLALTFVLILMLTRYISWNGAMSLFENHVFLLPAPFWQ